MSRAHFSRPVQDNLGNILAGGSVMLYDPATGSPYGGTAWADINASVMLSPPWVSSNGIIDFFLDQPQFITVGYTPIGGTEILFPNVVVSSPGFYVVYLPYSFLGPIFVTPGDLGLYVEDNMIIQSIRASLGVVCAGSPTKIDILIDGVSVFTDTAHLPTLNPGDVTTVVTPDRPIMLSGQKMTMDVIAVGSSTSGSDLTVQVMLRQQSPDGSYPA